MADQIKKMYIGGQIDAEDYRRFFRLAVSLGKQISDLVPVAILYYMGMAEYEDESKVPLEIRFHRKLVQIRRSADIENVLRDMALAYVAAPNEETSEMLSECAAEAGYTREEILEWISEDRLVPLGNTATTLDKAVDFLSRMIEPGQEYPTIDIIEKGKAEGFTEGTINAAKRKLGIRSERRPKCWVWKRDV